MLGLLTNSNAIRTGGPVGSPIHAPGGVIGIVYSPDAQLVALATLDKTASLWDAASGHREGTIPTDLTGPALAFTPDGSHIVIGYEGWAPVWPLDLASWEGYACQVAGRDLTPDEWSQLLPGRRYQPVCAPAT